MVRIIAALVLLTLPFSAQAANRYWDGANTGGTGDGASDGGTAAWNTSTLNWDQGNALNRVAWVNGNNDTAIFGGTAGTVSLGTGVTVGGLQFDSAAYIVQNNTLTFGTAGSIVANADATISSVITGSVTITKSGAGTLTLSGTNTYTGATIISTGMLKAGSSTALPAATTLNVTNTGVFDLNGFNATVASVGVGSSTAMITNSAAGSTTNTLTITAFINNVQFAPVITEGAGQKTAVLVAGSQSTPWLANANNTFSGGLTISSSSGQTRLWAATMTTVTNADGSIRSSNLGAGPVIIGTTTAGAQLGNFGANAEIRNPLVFNASTYVDGGNAAFRADSPGIKLFGQLTANLSPVNFSSGGSGSVIALGQITGPNGLRLKTPATSITLTLSNSTVNANNYQGTTTLDAKTTLVLGGNEQIPNGSSAGNVMNNGTFNLNGFSDTINGLSGTGIVDGVSSTPTLTVGDNNATSTFSGVIKNTAGALALTKIGEGTLTLSGTNTYTGATTVSAGTLVGVTGGSCSSSVVTVASGATLVARVVSGGEQWSCGTLTLDSGTTTAEFDFSAIPSFTVAPMLINGDLINNGTLNVRVVSGNFGTGSTYPLIEYTGSLTIGALTTNLPAGVEGTLVNNTVNKTIDLNVTTGNSLIWSAGTGVWDINTSSNWNNQTTTYADGSRPLFDDSPAGEGPFTVTLSSNVLPSGVTVSNELKAYTIGGSGSIAGAAELIKSGAGILTLTGTNTYTGATTVRGGSLQAGSAAAIPTNSALSLLNTGVFDLNGFDATVASVGSGSSAAVITNSAAGSGTNTLTITTFPSISFAPRIVDGSGQKVALVVGGNQAIPSLGNANNTFSGGLTISSRGGQTRLWQGTITTTTNADGSIKSSHLGAGPVIIGTTTAGAQLANIPANTQIRNPLVFNAGTYLDGGNAAFRADSFGIELYGQLTANLSPVNLSSAFSGSVNALGQITGLNGLWLKTPGTAFTLTLSNITASANDYQGTTRIDPKTTLALGKNEQIPHGASAGNVTNNGTFSLNGFNETINGLSGTGVVDSVSGTPTLTVGDNDATSTFAGVIKNTAGTLALTKIGTGTLTLTGVNTYTGTTTVSEGRLTLFAPGSIGNTPLISIAAEASFDAGSGFTLESGQTMAGAGTVVSDVEIDGALSPGIGGIGTLTASNSVTWNAGVAWPFDVGADSASDRLSINGDFTMGAGGEGEFEFDLQNSAVAGVYTLVTWTAATTFDDGTEFSAINIPGGLTPSFTVNANELLLTLTGEGGGGFSAGSTNTSISVVGGQVSFGFNIASGALYYVQASTNLLALIDNGFTNITSQLTNSQAGTIIYTNTSTNSLSLFRINSP